MLCKLASSALTLIALCLASSAVARADTVAFTAGFTGIASPPAPGRCASPALTVSIANAPGTANPFGAVTTTQSHCISPPSLDFTDGIFTFTFADLGSTFFGTYGGTLAPLAPPVFGIDGIAVITGGTGLFAGATGSALASGTNNVVTGEFNLLLNGTVTAPGLTAIPEPTTLLLLGTGLAGVGAAVGKRRKTQKNIK